MRMEYLARGASLETRHRYMIKARTIPLGCAATMPHAAVQCTQARRIMTRHTSCLSCRVTNEAVAAPHTLRACLASQERWPSGTKAHGAMQDLVELRNRNWVARRKVEGPTITYGHFHLHAHAAATSTDDYIVQYIMP